MWKVWFFIGVIVILSMFFGVVVTVLYITRSRNELPDIDDLGRGNDESNKNR